MTPRCLTDHGQPWPWRGSLAVYGLVRRQAKQPWLGQDEVTGRLTAAAVGDGGGQAAQIGRQRLVSSGGNYQGGTGRAYHRLTL